ncbi:hypothetical protein JCM5353_004734 [Sporobolomyces roseus]
MSAPSAPPSSDEEGDHEYVEMQESEPEQPNTRVPTASLASRFKSLCKASPPPSPPPPPPSKPTTTVSIAAPPPPSRRQINLNNPRSTGVRSCDQCRISKQKCDRNRPCASCAMRGLSCSWSHTGRHEVPIARPTQIQANEAEIVRLRRQVATLSKVLRLTPQELETLAIEAKRLAEGGPSAVQPPHQKEKRFRSNNENNQEQIENGPPSKAQKLVHGYKPTTHTTTVSNKFTTLTSPALVRPIARSLPPLLSTHRAAFEMPVVRLNSSPLLKTTTMSTSPAHRVATDSRKSSLMNPSMDRPRPIPRSSFSTLPPLTIPSLSTATVHHAFSRQHQLKPSLTSALSSPHLRSSLASSHPNSSSSPRRPHYVLPTPIYSATPTSASFLPLSATSRPLSSFMKSWPSIVAREEDIASRGHMGMVQPYTPISAVRDERRESVGGESVKAIVKKEVIEEETDRSLSPARRVVTPTLRNLLNDD